MHAYVQACAHVGFRARKAGAPAHASILVLLQVEHHCPCAVMASGAASFWKSSHRQAPRPPSCNRPPQPLAAPFLPSQPQTLVAPTPLQKCLKCPATAPEP